MFNFGIVGYLRFDDASNCIILNLRNIGATFWTKDERTLRSKWYRVD